MKQANHLSCFHLQRRKQRLHAVPFVIMGAPLRLAWLHRQKRLHAIEHLESAISRLSTTLRHALADV
jgi:hypothetical protein